MREVITDLSNGLPIIVTGDLNETATGGGYSQLARRQTADQFNLSNGYAASGAAPGKTFHGYSGGVDGTPIDHVLYSTEDFRAVSGNIVRTTFDGYYPSDHYPLEVSMEIVPRIPGDYDRNGVVDAADLATWRQNYGSVSAPASDGNGNGIIDAADYVLVRRNIGLEGNSGAQAAAAEPQVATSVLICIISTVLGARPTRIAN
jgi:hypothetical protein